MTEGYKCAKAPCKSCPYRKDVPSAVWAKHEYDKLPQYDGTILEQVLNGGHGPFFCHSDDTKLCAGWVGTHGAKNLFAMRLFHDQMDDSVWTYKSPVPLFGSGAAAAKHGMKNHTMPDIDSRRVVQRLLRRRERERKLKKEKS